MENKNQISVGDIVRIKKNYRICKVEEIYGKLIRIKVLNSEMNTIIIIAKNKVEYFDI